MPPNQVVRKIKKGELLFNEGDPSKAMYYVQSGSIRLFKRKVQTAVELGMIRKGEVIGEMGFLDGGPRSASAEAFQDTELIEISTSGLADQMKALPQWLAVLLKTIVNRLRSANNKIRQLEITAAAYTYGAEGLTSTNYQFLSPSDLIKICAACLLVGSRKNSAVPFQYLNHYGSRVMGVHENKSLAALELFEQLSLLTLDRKSEREIDISFSDLDQIETLVQYFTDETNQLRKVNISSRTVFVMEYLQKHLGSGPHEGVKELDVGKIIETEKVANNGKEPFTMEDFAELIKIKLAFDINRKDEHSILAKINAPELVKTYRIQKFLKLVEALNEQKSDSASRRVPIKSNTATSGSKKAS